MRVRLKRSAKADIEAATVWYENQKSGLAAEFVERVREAIDRIARNPEGYVVCCGCLILRRPRGADQAGNRLLWLGILKEDKTAILRAGA